MVRIAVGGWMHESNTFAASRTDLAAFESGGLETGAGIFRRWGAAHHEVGGFFEGASEFGFEAVPTLMAWATPAGPLSAETYREMSDRLIRSIKEAGPVDAVLLALHGAMVAEGEADADGATLARVRELIGPDRPLVVTLDFHANVSPLMAEASDALIAYRTYPHVDQRGRGKAAARLAFEAAQRLIRPTQALAKPRLLIHLLAQETDREPLRGLMAQLAEFDRSHGFLDASILAGFPYADVAATGPSCVVVTDDNQALAVETAERLSARLWEMRRELTASPPGPAEAVARALAATKTPVLLIDLGDNVGGGSAADGTVLIHELVRQGATGSIVVLYDPDAVRECVRAGVGGDVEVSAGGKIDRNSPPLPLRGRVRSLHDGRYVEEAPRHGGIRINDQGLTAVVETADENLVVLTTLRHPPFSLRQLTSLGLRPEAARAIVVKAAVAYKAAYAPLAGTIIEADTPGLTAANPARFTYRSIRRPMFPIDPEPVEEGRTHMTMPAPLIVAAVQMDVRLGDVSHNRAQMIGYLKDAVATGAQLVVFPECALTGYGFESREEALTHAETIDGPSVKLIADDCAWRKVHAVFGFLERDGDRLYNACVLVGPGGVLGSYRKVHLPFLGVDRFADPGDRPFAVHEVKGVRIGMHICYDGTFPEVGRVLTLLGADALILPTNWPRHAERAAEHMPACRALENVVYVMAVNRVGEEGGFRYIGRSSIVTPEGDKIASAGPDFEEILYAEIDPALSRQKRQVRVPGKHEIDRIADRRPGFYGALVEPNGRD